MTKETEEQLTEVVIELKQDLGKITDFLIGDKFNPGGFNTFVKKSLSSYNTKILALEERTKQEVEKSEIGLKKQIDDNKEEVDIYIVDNNKWRKKIDIIYYKVLAVSVVGGFIIGILIKVWDHFNKG